MNVYHLSFKKKTARSCNRRSQTGAGHSQGTNKGEIFEKENTHSTHTHTHSTHTLIIFQQEKLGQEVEAHARTQVRYLHISPRRWRRRRIKKKKTQQFSNSQEEKRKASRAMLEQKERADQLDSKLKIFNREGNVDMKDIEQALVLVKQVCVAPKSPKNSRFCYVYLIVRLVWFWFFFFSFFSFFLKYNFITQKNIGRSKSHDFLLPSGESDDSRELKVCLRKKKKKKMLQIAGKKYKSFFLIFFSFFFSRSRRRSAMLLWSWRRRGSYSPWRWLGMCCILSFFVFFLFKRNKD